MTTRRAPALRIARRKRDLTVPAPGGPTPPVEALLNDHVRGLYAGSIRPVHEIAARSGVTPRAIYRYARKLGMTGLRRGPLPSRGSKAMVHALAAARRLA